MFLCYMVLRDGIEYRLYGWAHGIACHIEPGGSDDTGACRLHNRSMVKRV